jgi:two-component system chemotaxis sensor kinase CheA
VLRDAPDSHRELKVVAPAALPEALLARFRALAFDRLERIDAAWIELTGADAAPEAKTEEAIFQELHTLKGDARVVGLADVAVLCQKLEELLALAQRRRFRVHEDVDIVATMAIQFVGMLLRKGTVARGGIDLEGFLAQIEHVLADWRRRSSEAPQAAVHARAHLHTEAPHPASAATRARLAVVGTRVYLEHLRATGRSRDRLHQVWEELSRELAHLDVTQVAPLVARHVAAGADLARELGKSIEFSTEATEVQAAAEVFDALDTAVLHSIRNAIDHGVEPPEDRARAGKPATGRVIVRVRQREDRLTIEVADDGGGVDFDAVRRRAAQMGLASREELEAATEEQLAQLVFAPGFSTRDAATEISGRGIGLDAVRAAVARFGGDVRLETARGRGTTTRIEVPGRHASLQVLAFRGDGADVVFAVDARWTRDADPPRPGCAPALDPVKLLEIPRHEGSAAVQVLRFRRGATRVALCIGGAPRRARALRVCPTPEDAPLEVVGLGDKEAVLLRPDVLARGAAAGRGRR